MKGIGHLDPEIRSEVTRIKTTEKEAKVLDAAFDEGRFAFVSGITRDECRFRNPARKNAWERGWLESQRERAEHESIKGMSESEKAEMREKLSALKSMIEG
jgi:ribosome modulation factor